MQNNSKENFRAKYQDSISKQLGSQPKTEHSRSYTEFKQTFYPQEFTLYEKICKWCENIVTIKSDQKSTAALAENIRLSHLNITPAGALSFALIIPLAAALIFILICSALSPGNWTLFLMFGAMLWGILLMIAMRVPELIANNMRLKASNQMVQCIFYVVTYMRHSSNLELAIDFAAERVGAPLSFDLKKVLWDVETEKYGTIKESLDNYLE